MLRLTRATNVTATVVGCARFRLHTTIVACNMSQNKDNKSSFSTQDDESLIELVSKHPFLYDARILPDHRNTTKREKTWEEIATALNKAGEGTNCKNRWKTIKDSYFRQLKKNKSSTGSLNHPKSKFEQYRRLLTFLDVIYDDEMQQQPAISSSMETDHRVPTATTSSMDISLEPVPGPSGLSHNFDQPAGDSDHSPRDDTGSPKKREKRHSKCYRRHEDRPKYVRNKYPRHKGTRSSLTVKSDDQRETEIDLFTRQANSILKNLPVFYQITSMHELFEVLTRYKMKAAECATGTFGQEASTSAASQCETSPMDLTPSECSEHKDGADKESQTLDEIPPEQEQNQPDDVSK